LSICIAHYAKNASILRYVFQCVVKRNVFSADLKKLELSDGLQRWSGKRFQSLGTAMEKARRPNQLQ